MAGESTSKRTTKPGVRHSAFVSSVVMLLKSLYHSFRSLWAGEVPARAAALTYTTLLATVPFLIVLSSVAAQLGYLPILSRVLPELRDSFGVRVPLDWLEEIVRHAQAVPMGRLGILGGVSFLITFLLAVSNLEQAINRIWKIDRGRNWLVKLRDYVPFLLFLVLFALLVAWILVELRTHLNLVALASSGRQMDERFPLRAIVGATLGLTWLGIAVLYYLIPHSKVRIRHAAIGATFSTILLFCFFYLMLKLQSLLFSRYSLLYGSLAGLPLAMLVVYFGWTIILMGAVMTHRYHSRSTWLEPAAHPSS
ncbi:MAG: YihY/virulence factor BrkB family protein [Candidatus Eisenbacteria bacterium]|nr:YihY/virulence factor BrkB family protein [Candidatus Eisenbacteria bacterium]